MVCFLRSPITAELTRQDFRRLKSPPERTNTSRQTETHVSTQPPRPPVILQVDRHLFAVKEAIWDARVKWWAIGGGLRVSYSELEEIKNDLHLQDDGERLERVLFCWISTGNATIQDLLKVLKSEIVGRADIADQISALETEEDRANVGLIAAKDSSDHHEHKDLCGVEVIARTTLTVTSSAQSFYWSGYGFKLNIPLDSLPPGVDKCVLHISASLAGKYQLPDGLKLVSAVFWVRCDPPCIFQQRLMVEIQHCGVVNDHTKFKFIRASSQGVHDRYNFSKMRNSSSLFTKHSSYGSIQLDHFCATAVAAEGSVEMNYCFNVYYHGKIKEKKIDFVVMKNTDAYITAVTKHYNKRGAVGEDPQTIGFRSGSDSIILDIPREGVRANGGWRIKRWANPSVMKSEVDSHAPGKNPIFPYCQLRASCSSETDRNVPNLTCTINVLGAKEPFTYFDINMNPYATESPSVNPAAHAQPTENQTNVRRYQQVLENLLMKLLVHPNLPLNFIAALPFIFLGYGTYEKYGLNTTGSGVIVWAVLLFFLVLASVLLWFYQKEVAKFVAEHKKVSILIISVLVFAYFFIAFKYGKISNTPLSESQAKSSVPNHSIQPTPATDQVLGTSSAPVSSEDPTKFKGPAHTSVLNRTCTATTTAI